MEIVERSDQLIIVLNNPTQKVKHFSLVEIKGCIVNLSSDTLIIISKSFSTYCKGRLNPNIPNVFPPKFSTDELILLTIEIDKNEIDPIENMFVGNIRLQYRDSSEKMYLTAPALFQLYL